VGGGKTRKKLERSSRKRGQLQKKEEWENGYLNHGKIMPGPRSGRLVKIPRGNQGNAGGEGQK